MSGSLPLLPLYSFVTWKGKTLSNVSKIQDTNRLKFSIIPLWTPQNLKTRVVRVIKLRLILWVRHVIRTGGGGGPGNSEMCYFQISENTPRDCRCGALFAKLRKATISFVKSVCLYVCMERLASKWTDFHEISHLNTSRKSISENSRFIKNLTIIKGTLH